MIYKRWMPLFFILPIVAYTLIFFIYPFFLLLLYSFSDATLYSLSQNFIGTENYISVFREGRVYFYLQNSIIYTVVVSFASLMLGMVFALLTNSIKHKKLQRIFSISLMLPMMLLPVAVGVTWGLSLTEYYGWVNFILEAIGFRREAWLLKPYALWFVMLADVWGWTPFMFIVLLAALQQVPPSILDAAEVDGATRFNKFRFIIFPTLKPVIITLTTLKLIDTYKEFDMLWVMTRGGPGDLSTNINVIVYKSLFNYFKLGRASCYGVISLIFPILVLIIYYFIIRRRGKD
jgi:multiple sugar transport system permease protein